MRSWASLDDGTLLVSLDAALVRIDAASGAIRWRRRTGGPMGLVAATGRAFAAVGLDLDRIDIDTGTPTRVLSVTPTCSEGCFSGIESLTLIGDRLMVTGSFTGPGEGFLVLDVNSGAILRTAYPAGIYAIRRGLVVGSRIYVITGSTRPLAALDADSFDLLDWRPPILGAPSDLVAVGPYLVTAGGYGGQVLPRTGGAAIRLPDGTLTGFQPSLGFTIATSMATAPGKVFIAGYQCFTTRYCFANETGEPVLGQYDAATGARTVGWAPSLNGRIGAMAVSGSRLFVGGGFSAIDGVPRSCLASFDISGPVPVLEPWAPDVACTREIWDPNTISALLPSASGVFVAGRFDAVGGQPRRYLALVDASTGAVDPWNLITDAAAYHTVPVSLAVQGSLLVVGGPVVAGRAPAVFDVTQRMPVPAGPGNEVRAQAQAVFFDTEIVLATGESMDPATGRITDSARTFMGPGQVIAATSGIVHNLHYFPRVTIPGEPRSLRATVTGYSVQLQWEPPASGGGSVGAPLGYTLEVAATPAFTGASSFTLGTALSYSAVAPAGHYYLRIRARGTGGVGPPSNPVFVAPGPLGCSLPPVAPQNPQSATSGLAFTWSWTQPAGDAVESYDLRVGTTPTDLSLAAVRLPPVPTFSASGPPGQYYWSVRATNGCGVSEFSPPVMVRLQSVQAPTGLRSTVSIDRTVTLEWTPPADGPTPSGYVVEAGSAPGLADLASLATAGSPLVVPGVPAGTYFVQVRSRLGGDVSASSQPTTVVVP